MIIPLSFIKAFIARLKGKRFCRHHTPWKLCCKKDQQGIFWKCCKCGKERTVFI